MLSDALRSQGQASGLRVSQPRSGRSVVHSGSWIHCIGEVNKREDIKNLVILITDISDFYPALDFDECTKIVAKMCYVSGI